MTVVCLQLLHAGVCYRQVWCVVRRLVSIFIYPKYSNISSNQVFSVQNVGPFPKKNLNTLKEINVMCLNINLLCCCFVPYVKGLGPWIFYDVGDK